MIETLAKRRRARPSSEDLGDLRDAVARATADRKDGSLRVDFGKLDDAQAAEVVRLANAAFTGRTFDAAKLSKRDLAAWEGLLERAAGLPAGTFAAERAETEACREIAELARQAVRRPVTREEELGLLAAVALQVAEGYLRAQDVAVLALVLVALQTGTGLGPKSFVETDPSSGAPRLVFDNLFGLLGGRLDPDAKFSDANSILEHLQKNEWVVFQRRGPESSVTLGRRATLALAAKRRAAA